MDIQPLGNAAQPGATAPPAPDPTVGAGVPASPTVAPTTAPTAQTVAPVQPQPTMDQVTQAVQKINAAMAAQAQGIEFSIDPDSHRIVVNIVDQQTNQVIRQIPSKEALAISDSLEQTQGGPTQGLLLKQQA
jgi:flagellar protein FlaG